MDRVTRAWPGDPGPGGFCDGFGWVIRWALGGWVGDVPLARGGHVAVSLGNTARDGPKATGGGNPPSPRFASGARWTRNVNKHQPTPRILLYSCLIIVEKLPLVEPNLRRSDPPPRNESQDSSTP